MFVYNVLKNKNIIFDNPPKYTFLFYSHKQDLYSQMLSEVYQYIINIIYCKGYNIYFHLFQKIIFKAFQKFPTYSELRDLTLKYKEEGTAIILDDVLFHLNEQTARVFLEL